MVIPQIPLVSFILRNTLKVGTAPYTAQGPGIAKYLFAGISIVLCKVDNPEQAGRVASELNKVASLNKSRSRVHKNFIQSLDGDSPEAK